MRDETGNRGGPQKIPRPRIWRPGNRPSWLDPDFLGSLSLTDVEAKLGGRSGEGKDTMAERMAFASVVSGIQTLPPAPRSNSGVAVILSPGDHGLEVLLTQRAKNLRTHQGEVSFPGGGEEEGDADITETALREANEEVGLDLSTVSVVGELDYLATFSSDRKIVPVVVSAPKRPTVVAQPSEVDAIIHAPLVELASHEVFREELWGEGEGFPMWFFELIDNTVWGATAAMLHQLLRILSIEE